MTEDASGRDPAPAAPAAASGTATQEEPTVERPRRSRTRGLPGCLAVVVALVVVAAAAWFGLSRGVEFVKDQLASPGDYAGPGRGKVVFQVHQGDTVGQMGRNLKDAGVVKSVDAFVDAAAEEPDSERIQVGFYELRKEMRASDVVDVLVDPDNLVSNTFTIPEGLRLTAILDLLAERTDFDRAAYQKVLDNPDSLGLPDYAGENAEGYLFPATYDYGPNATPRSILKQMVDRWRVSAEDQDLEGKAAELGYTPAEVMIVASLVEAEASRPQDFGKVARVIYNRLETEGYPTYGKLEIDATIAYGLGFNPGVGLTPEQLRSDTPYNTRLRPGLPPTPIEAPGDRAIEAALNPTDGPWFFYVTTNLATGLTKFTADYDEFLRFKAELRTYCDTSDAC